MNDNTIELRTLKIVYSESTTIYQRKKKDIRRSNVSMWVAVCRWTLTCSYTRCTAFVSLTRDIKALKFVYTAAQ